MAIVTRVSHGTRSGFSPTSGLAMACQFLLLVSSAVTPSFGFSGVRGEDEGNRGGYLYPEILRDEAVARLHQLGKVSDGDGYLERIFMSPAAVRAGNLIREWMEDAGLRTWVDCLGNIHGRVKGRNASAEALLIGSHLKNIADRMLLPLPK